MYFITHEQFLVKLLTIYTKPKIYVILINLKTTFPDIHQTMTRRNSLPAPLLLCWRLVGTSQVEELFTDRRKKTHITLNQFNGFIRTMTFVIVFFFDFLISRQNIEKVFWMFRLPETRKNLTMMSFGGFFHVSLPWMTITLWRLYIIVIIIIRRPLLYRSLILLLKYCARS